MDKEIMKDDVILTVKEAIWNNSVCQNGEDCLIVMDDSDIDHTAEQATEKLIENGYGKVSDAKEEAVKEFASEILKLCAEQDGAVYDIDIKRLLKKNGVKA